LELPLKGVELEFAVGVEDPMFWIGPLRGSIG
jgi:hypothetical protein